MVHCDTRCCAYEADGLCGSYVRCPQVKYVNVMFVDNPVGTGFSYVDSTSKLTTNNKQIASDLVELTRGFLKRHPQFRNIPVYVFSESYGGKMAAEFALNLFKVRKTNKVADCCFTEKCLLIFCVVSAIYRRRRRARST